LLHNTGLFYVIGARQRMPMRWILVGIAVPAFVGAFHEMGMHWSDLPGQSEFSVGLGLYPPFLYSAEHQSMRLLANMALVAGAYWFWLRKLDTAPG
jgi:hypothetical protein